MISVEERSIQALKKAVEERKQVLYISSHPLLIHQRRRQLLEITAGYTGIRWATLNQFTEQILQACGVAYVRIDQATREDLVESMMLRLEAQGKLFLLKNGLRFAGMNKSVALWIEDLEKRSGEEWIPFLKTVDEPVLQELNTVYEAYIAQTRLKEFPYKETEQVYHIADNLFKEEEAARNLLADVVVVEGYFPHTEGVTQLLETIRGLASELVWIPPVSVDFSLANKRKLRFLVGTTMNDEARVVVDDLMGRLEEGVPEDEIVVAAPDHLYIQAVKRELRAQGLLIQAERTSSLLELPVTKRILSLLQLRKNNWNRAYLLTCTKLYASLMGLSDAEVAWGRAIITESGVMEGCSNWLTLFRGYEARSRSRLEHLQGEGDTEQVVWRLASAKRSTHSVTLHRRNGEPTLLLVRSELPTGSCTGEFTFIPGPRIGLIAGFSSPSPLVRNFHPCRSTIRSLKAPSRNSGISTWSQSNQFEHSSKDDFSVKADADPERISRSCALVIAT